MEILENKFGKSFIDYYEAMKIDESGSWEARMRRNKELMRSLPKLTFELSRDFHPELRKLLEEVKVKVRM